MYLDIKEMNGRRMAVSNRRCFWNSRTLSDETAMPQHGEGEHVASDGSLSNCGILCIVTPFWFFFSFVWDFPTL